MVLKKYRLFIQVVCAFSLLCISGCALKQKKETSSTSTSIQALDNSSMVAVSTPPEQKNSTWQTHSVLKSAQESPYTALMFSPDNQFLLTCNQKGIIEVWNVQENTLHTTWQVKDPIHAFAFSPDGTQLAATTQRAQTVFDDKESTLYMWQWPSCKVVHTIHNPTGVNFLQYAHDGKELITASLSSRLINFWNPTTGVLQRSLHLAVNDFPLNSEYDDKTDYTYENITVSPDGHYIASTHNHEYYPTGPDWDPEVAYNYRNEICVVVWDGTDGKCIKKINTGLLDDARCARHNEIIFSPDGKYLATGHIAGQLCIINMTDWSVLKLEQHYTGEYLAGQQILTFSPDNTYLAATNLMSERFPDEKHATIIWNIQTGKLEKKYEQSSHIAFSFDGKQFALCKNQTDDTQSAIEIFSHL